MNETTNNRLTHLFAPSTIPPLVRDGFTEAITDAYYRSDPDRAARHLAHLAGSFGEAVARDIHVESLGRILASAPGPDAFAVWSDYLGQRLGMDMLHDALARAARIEAESAAHGR
jgi:hypothetical protein